MNECPKCREYSNEAYIEEDIFAICQDCGSAVIHSSSSYTKRSGTFGFWLERALLLFEKS